MVLYVGGQKKEGQSEKEDRWVNIFLPIPN